MSTSTTRLPTVGEIARRLAVPLHRVEYVLRTSSIRPIGRAGNARLYRDEDIELIRRQLAARQEGCDAQ